MSLNYKEIEMTKKVITTSLVAGAMLTLIGCGGGSGGDTSSVGTNPAPVATTGTGFYIDSAVSGVNYTCGSQEGTTGPDGSFTFDVDASCTFTLAGVELRSVDATALEDNVQIIEQNPKVAQLLQSLDIDGDPRTGITITKEVVAAIVAAGFDGIPTDDTEVQALVAAAEEAVETFTGGFVTEEAAVEHVTETVAQVAAGEAVFDLPVKFYEMEEEHYGPTGQTIYEAKLFGMTETKFSMAAYVFVNGTFITEDEAGYDNGDDYVLQNGAWVLENETSLAASLSEDKKTYILDNGIHQLTFKSIRDLEGETAYMDDSEIGVEMPAGAERTVLTHTVLQNVYGIDHIMHGDISTLEEVVSLHCEGRYFDDIDKEGLDMEGVAFDCNDAGKTSGTLVGVNYSDDYSSYELIQDIGTWQITTLPGSDIRAIVTEVKPEYTEGGDSGLFAMKDGQVWQGWHDKAGDSGDFGVYNEVAFKAFEAHLKAIPEPEPTSVAPTVDPEPTQTILPVTDAELKDKVFYFSVVDQSDGSTHYIKSSFYPSSSFIYTEEEGVNPVDQAYFLIDGKIVIEDGEVKTMIVLAKYSDHWIVQKEGSGNDHLVWHFSKPSDFPASL